MPDGLVLLKLCGERACEPYQYCSDGSCTPCNKTCSPQVEGAQHNFDPQLCEKHCQDYIHDKVKHYVTYVESKQMQKELRGEMIDTIEGLRTMVAFSLTLSLLVGVAMLAGLGFAWLKYRRHRRQGAREKEIIGKKIPSVSEIVNNNKDCGGGNGLRVDLPPAGVPPSVATTTTPISTRHPSEDATLEYAYDNPGMTPSPVLADNRGETNF